MSKKSSETGTDYIDRAPSSVSRWAYGVLAVFSVASIGLGIFNQSLISLVLTSCLVLILFFAIYGFARVTTSRNGWWEWIGRAMTFGIFSIILCLFGVVIYYIVTGEPQGLDFWFRPPVGIPQAVSVQPG